MASITLNHIDKTYDDGFHAIKDVNLEIEDGEFVILVGPSGSGKSTLLRMIVGLEDITDGEMLIDGRRVNEAAPKDRNLAMVFQNYALYPHLTVYENIAFPLRMAKASDSEIKQRVDDAADLRVDLVDGEEITDSHLVLASAAAHDRVHADLFHSKLCVGAPTGARPVR